MIMKLYHYSLLVFLVLFLACTKTESRGGGSVTLLVSNNVRGQLDPCG